MPCLLSLAVAYQLGHLLHSPNLWHSGRLSPWITLHGLPPFGSLHWLRAKWGPWDWQVTPAWLPRYQ